MMSCPYCKHADVQRSRRRGFLERVLLRLLLLAPMRCLACQRRFIIFTYRSGHRGKPIRSADHRNKKTALGPLLRRMSLPALLAAVMFAATLLLTFFLLNE